MKIRKANLKDAEDIAKVEINRGYSGKIKFDAFKRTKKLFKEKGVYVFVAEKNKKIIGYRAFIKKGTTANPGYLSIEKTFQNRGTGYALMKYSIKHALKLGCKKMTIFVRNDNFIAINLYNKLQFKVMGVVRPRDKLKLKMEKKLK